jgi:hypothetical protein
MLPVPNTSRPTRRPRLTKQLADIEGMITQGCNALIILAQDSPRSGRRSMPLPMQASRSSAMTA